jgi:hypothetical protein
LLVFLADSTGRCWRSALIPPVSVTTTTGQNWQAFEGSFPWVPDFTPIPNTATGQCTGLDLSVRTRDDNISLLYTGYLNVPADGIYTLYLNTDGRAFLRIHEASVLDADFGYTGGTEVSAGIRLKAGRHPLRLGYVRGAGGTPSLTLQWSSSDITKQAVPATALVREATPPAIVGRRSGWRAGACACNSPGAWPEPASWSVPSRPRVI